MDEAAVQNDLREQEEKQLKLGEDDRVGPGDFVWVKHNQNKITPGEIIEYSGNEGSVKIRWFTNTQNVPGWSSAWGSNEWVLTDETQDVDKECLANSMEMYRWDEWARFSHKKRSDSYFYRLTLDSGDRLRGFNKLSVRKLMTCACGKSSCNDSLRPDLGYAYCTTCIRGTQLNHLPGDDEVVRFEKKQLWLVNNKGKKRAKCACGGQYGSIPLTIPEGRASEFPTVDVSCSIDPGTESIHVRVDFEKESPIQWDLPSRVFVPDADPKKIIVGIPTVGQDGISFAPLKTLLWPSKADQEKLRKLNMTGQELYQAAIDQVIEQSREKILVPHSNHTTKSFQAICIAFPCCLTSDQKSACVSGALRQEARIFCSNEAESSFWSVDKKLHLPAGLYGLMDFGATTSDFAVLEKIEADRISIISESGAKIGANYPEEETANYLKQQRLDLTYDECFQAAKGYGGMVKRGEVIGDHNRFGIDIKQQYEENMKCFIEKLTQELPPWEGDWKEVNSIIVCGGGARSHTLQGVIRKRYGVTVEHNDETETSTSQVVQGNMIKMQRVLKGKTCYFSSPATICLEQDKPNLRSHATELLVLVSGGQGLVNPVLPDSQRGFHAIVQDVYFGDSDIRLRFQASVLDITYTTNDRGRLIVDKTRLSKDAFFDIAEVSIPCGQTKRAGRRENPDALAFIWLTPDIDASVITCQTLVVDYPPRECDVDSVEGKPILEVQHWAENHKLKCKLKKFAAVLNMADVNSVIRGFSVN